MLKPKPLSYYQSSIFGKKPKKRSTSTSANKQNLSITHNNSIVLETNSNLNSKSHLNQKSAKNPSFQKDKSKKTKKSQSRQRSTSKLPLTNNLVQNITTKPKQPEIQPKKTKKSRNNSTSILYPQNQQKSYAKSFINETNQNIQLKNLKHVKYSSIVNNFLPEMSKSSTIVSSTGNIQFSELSRQDQHEKNFDLLSANNLINFSKHTKSAHNSNREQLITKSARQRPTNSNKYKITPVRAAIIIQKTWRGYLTRKLLSQYINSFEPLYEEQLKDIRSGRQSRNEAKCHEKSSFFDKSQLEECSEIEPLGSQVSESFRTTSKIHNGTSSFIFTENNQQEQSSKVQSSIRQSRKVFEGKAKGNEESCDLPVQFFKRPVVLAQTSKRDESNSISEKNNDDYSLSSRRKNAMKVTPQTASRISEFTVKNPTTQTSRKQEPCIQETLKHPHRKPFTLGICPRTTSISISPQQTSGSTLEKLENHCKSLSTLFHSFNSMCIANLKTEIKMNRLSVNELMERKDALKDIVDNGMEFVKNVSEEIQKAFKEMERITKEGCDSSSDREHRVNAKTSEESRNDSSSQRQEVPRAINPKQGQKVKPNQKLTPSEKISNQKYIDDLQSPPFEYEASMDSSSSRKNNKNSRCVRQNMKSGTSEFYTIELPTEEYSEKGKSPIQEDYNEDDSYREEDDEQNDEPEEQEYTSSRTIKMNRLYASHQQSLQILNQFLLNLIEEYQETLSTKNISELEFLCETLKRVSCDSQNKTIIDRCLIEFIVEIMSQTWTLRQIYEGFRKIIQQGISEDPNEDEQEHFEEQDSQQDPQQDYKLLQTIRKWIEQLYKWQMNIIQQVPSKMESSSFINTENISLINTENLSINELRQAVNNLSNPMNFQLDLPTNTHYK